MSVESAADELPAVSLEEFRARSFISRVRERPLIVFTDVPFAGLSLVSLAAAFGLWELFVSVLDVQIVILPPPSLVFETIVEYAVSGDMLRDSAATMYRVVAGLAIGIVSGIAVGLLIGWYPRGRAVLNPLVEITFPIPKIALVSLLIIWFGIGDMSKLALVTIGVFYVIVTNTVAGVEAVPKETVMAARNLGASDRQLFWKVILPGALPVILAAVRIGFSFAMVLVIAGEMIVSENGLGNYISFAGQLLRTERVFAGLVISGVLGLAGYRVLGVIEGWLVPMKSAPSVQL